MSNEIINSYRFVSAGGDEGILFCGSTPSGRTDVTETYDFTSFTTVTANPQPTSDLGGGGGSGDALSIAGSTANTNTCGNGAGYGYNNQCYNYQRDAWTTVNNTVYCKRGNMGGGTSVSGLSFGGDRP